MNLIDTHAHIYLDEFDKDRDEVLQRAKAKGVNKIMMPAIDSATHKSMLNLQSKFPDTCLSMMGLHPCSVKENFLMELQIVTDYLGLRKFIAMGEIGLDFYWDISFKKQQYEAFSRQLDWAIQFDIPVSVHSRNATEDCISVIREHQKGKLKGVFHCFSGTQSQAQELIELGFYLGVGGVVTFKNAGLDHTLKEIDMKHIILETDSPYLAPAPFRGKRNESSYICQVAAKLAEIKNLTPEEIASITTANAEKLFGL